MASPGSIGSAMPPSEDEQVRRFADLARFVRELGPSVARSLATTVATLTALVAQVQATLADIDATVQASIAANSYTQTQIDGKVANPPAGSAVTGNISSTGNMTSGGSLNALSVYSTILTSDYRAVWSTNPTGQLGYVPSSAEFKQDIADAVLSPTAVLALRLVTFRYIQAVIERGDAASVEWGVIAQEVHAAGLTWLVDYDEAGLPFGVKFDRIALAILPYLHSVEARLTAAGI